VTTGGSPTGGVTTGGVATAGAAGTAGTGGTGGSPASVWDGYQVSCDRKDDDGDGFSECEGDCDDANPAVVPIVVDANVAVAGDGTPANPFKTIAQAAAVLSSRTCRTIVLRPGTYTDGNVAVPAITSTGGPTVTFWQPPAGSYAIRSVTTGGLLVRGITIRSTGSTRSRGIYLLRPASGGYCGSLTVEASILEGLDHAVTFWECVGTALIQSNVFRNSSCAYDSMYPNCGAVTDQAGTMGDITINILDNQFDSNTSGGRGAAIAISHIAGRIERNVFANNAAAYEGGAVYLGSSGSAANFYLRNNWFGGNTSQRSGGGVYASVGSVINLYVENNVFNANIASADGGGAYLYGPAGAGRELVNNTFVDNSANRGGQVHIRLWPGGVTANAFIFSQGGGGVSAETWTDAASAPVFTYNDAYQNLPDYTGALTALTITGQDGNIAVDPGLVLLLDDLNPNNDDLHLGTTSPLRDAGPPRPASMNDVDGSRNDIGAYGGPYGVW
jgi:hypothetical protein